MSEPVQWFAPGRVNLIGEHTDYNAGLALPMALVLGCRCTLTSTDDRMLRVRSQQMGTTVAIEVDRLRPGMAWAGDGAWAAYVAGVVWAAGARRGATIDIDSDLPVGAGLSSSAAVCCAVASAVLEAAGTEPSPPEIAELATAAESRFVGAPTGRLDQLAVTRARADHAMLIDFIDDEVVHIPFRPADEGLALVVVDTGAPHAHLSGEYADRRESCRRACALLRLGNLREATGDDIDRLESPTLRRRARHVLTENDRVSETARLLAAGRMPEVGPLMTASHESMRHDYEITVPPVDDAVDALLEVGALGARMTGGGFGGCVIGLVPEGSADESIAAVRRRLEDDGLWAATLTAGAGARRAAL